MSNPVAFHLTETPLSRGTSLIEASAGTGKTYAITALFVRLLIEQNLSVREILVVTYTKAATEELRHRIRQVLSATLRAFAAGSSRIPFLQELVERHRGEAKEMEARLQSALWGFDEAPIYTIHGFCQRTLRDRAFESGILFDTKLVTDPSDILQEIADDFWRVHFYEASETVVHFALKNGLGPAQFVRLLQSLVNHPQMRFISQAKGHSLKSLSVDLENALAEARRVWRDENKTIKGLFGSASKWGNAPYNDDDKMVLLFEQLETCFSESETAFEAFESLGNFCASMLEKKKAQKSSAPAVPRHRFFELCEQICRAEQMWLAGLQLEFIEFARAELPKRKAQRKIQHYDDLLACLNDTLLGPNGDSLAKDLRCRYRAALIDEFQDTDPVQYQIFRQAFSGGSTFLFLIGDPKQAIYGFRGADIFTYMEAAGEASDRFTLGENWRSESGLVKAVNSIFSAAPNAFVFDRIAFYNAIPQSEADKTPLTFDDKCEPPFQFWFWRRQNNKEIAKVAAEKVLPPVVAGEIARLLNGPAKIGDQRLKPQDIAVLVLENKQAAKMQAALSLYNIPSVLYTTASLFASNEAVEFQRVLAGIALPGDERLVRAALATELFGVDGGKLAAFGEIEWQKWLERIHEYLELWQQHGFFRMFRHWLQQEQVRQRLLSFPDGERRLTNVLHLGEVLHETATERRLGVGGVLKWFADQADLGKQAPEEHQLRLESDENAVRLVTVHKSKGLEYPVVFSLFSWRGSDLKRGSEEEVIFHDPDDQLHLVRDLGPGVSDPHRQCALEERLAENVRLLYVAVTRAKHRCYFVWGGMRNAANSAPAWLFHRPSPLGKPIIPALESHFKQLGDDQLFSDSHQVETEAAGKMRLVDLPEANAEIYTPVRESTPDLRCREFTGRIQRDWVISSFTYFKAGAAEELPDRDRAMQTGKVEAPGSGIFALPKGAKVGTCLHQILEKLDFAAADDVITAVASEGLQAHGLTEPIHLDAVTQMLRTLMRFPLDPEHPDFKLERIPQLDRLSELEFYFPIQRASISRLYRLFEGLGWALDFTAPDARTQFDLVTGFLKGFIDLVLRFGERYYLVDWKSNWLGNQVEDYSQQAIREEMRREHYFVQYHFYTLALHKYLSIRLRDYDYDKHFGGVIYIFLRGLDPARPEFGVFRDRPKPEVISQLASFFEGE
jgi:exodeoxyribonuclease V beta subunit